ncbi:hypothetical protein MNBD_NITROSPINAE02-671 [hydrothermal vent metagenome]|uniref:Flagellar biosynthesis protein FliS n=1 Tax=hydrothermal vent metagenome TaxID=652676 RepID=A0A3B1C492_9ZZZZ
MYGNGKQNVYRANEVSTVSKAKLILLMYDGAIRFINEAIRRVDTNDVAGRGMYISKAQKIVDELNGALNHKAGGEVAVNLDKVYVEVSRNLIDANIKGSKEPLDSALSSMKGLRSAWGQVIKMTGKNGARPSNNQGLGASISL